ncbi:MAG: DNA polymerase subunit beta, partial [Methanobrevibacter sp.]|nr:DNA polymerase subunit beta [Methanobrevibacter sp.]
FWDFVFNKRIKDDSLSKAEFAWYEERKSNRGLIRDTLFDILATRNYDEIEGSWGDTIYEPVDFATINCKIVSALGSFDNPATYTIEDLDVIEGPDVEISELASRTHTYAGEVVDGEEVVARGLVEKVMKNGEFEKYRLLVGTTRESINEYIKLKESPVVDRNNNQ